MTVIRFVFRERKVPWVPQAVMAFKVLLVFLVRLVLRVPLERTVTRWIYKSKYLLQSMKYFFSYSVWPQACNDMKNINIIKVIQYIVALSKQNKYIAYMPCLPSRQQILHLQLIHSPTDLHLLNL